MFAIVGLIISGMPYQLSHSTLDPRTEQPCTPACKNHHRHSCVAILPSRGHSPEVALQKHFVSVAAILAAEWPNGRRTHGSTR